MFYRNPIFIALGLVLPILLALLAIYFALRGVFLSSSKFANEPSFVVDFCNYDPNYVTIKPWTNETRPSAGVQIYTGDNLTWENGALVIEARKEGDVYTSSRIYTKGLFEFKYGKLQVVAKLPRGAGTWPAIWARSDDEPYGEIDILEAQGARPDIAFFNVHNSISIDGQTGIYSGNAQIAGMSSEYHTYEVQWEPDVIRFLVDGTIYHQVDKVSGGQSAWPFERQYYLIINLAMGGKWARSLAVNTDLESKGGIDDTQQELWKFYIRSIKYFPYVE